MKKSKNCLEKEEDYFGKLYYIHKILILCYFINQYNTHHSKKNTSNDPFYLIKNTPFTRPKDNSEVGSS